MTSSYLFADLARDEGLRLAAYPDPLSGGDPWTIGYGHTGPEVAEGLTWTEDEADFALVTDVTDVTGDLDEALPWWRGLDDLRQDVLANMAFNMGIGGLLDFENMLAAAEVGDYETAAAEMLDSKWAEQVGNRAIRLSTQMLTGEHQDEPA